MKYLRDEVVRFFYAQPYAIVTTIDKEGYPHNSCKGIVKIEKKGRVFLLDLYKNRTYKNLLQSPCISITAVDEHKFRGYSLKGSARIIKEDDLTPEIIRVWEKRITQRTARRLVKNIQGKKGHPVHPEILLPKPEYMIVVDVKQVTDLAPHHIKKRGVL